MEKEMLALEASYTRSIKKKRKEALHKKEEILNTKEKFKKK